MKRDVVARRNHLAGCFSVRAVGVVEQPRREHRTCIDCEKHRGHCPVRRSEPSRAVFSGCSEGKRSRSQIDQPNPVLQILQESATRGIKAFFVRLRDEQNTSSCPSAREPRRQKIPPSFHPRFDLPKSRSSPDRGYADCFVNCHTTRLRATSFPLSTPVAPQVCNSTASESDSSPATASRRFHPRAQCRIRISSRADAYGGKSSTTLRRLAICPAPPRENLPRQAE